MSSPQDGPQGDKIDLCVVHGHLAFARFPVLVGHYVGDTFAGTEARLDKALGLRLSERRKVGLYPGRIGANAVLLHPDCKPPGAVVVGLGQPADLSIGTLRDTLRQGVLAYVIETLDQGCASAAASSPPSGLGLSCLCRRRGRWNRPRELCAGDASGGRPGKGHARAVAKARTSSARNRRTFRGSRVRDREGGEEGNRWRSRAQGCLFASGRLQVARGARRAGPLGDDPSWWQPIQITMPDAAKDRSLSFTIGGGFARAEARSVAANLDIVNTLLRRAARNIDIDKSPTSPGRILFELLWPDSLKQRSVEEQNRRLILDERSAAFPWELLDDRRPWTSADDVGRRLRALPNVDHLPSARAWSGNCCSSVPRRGLWLSRASPRR